MSSKRQVRRRQCLKKRRFVSEAEAQGAIASLSRAGRDRPGLHIYACQFCRGWHIGRAMNKFRDRDGLKVWEWNQGV